MTTGARSEAPASARPGLRLCLRGWAAWAPGVTDEAAWRAWSRAPDARALGRDGQPDVGFVPALLRRRCTRLTRMMLHVAFAACPEPERASARTVFASRHGGINDALPLIEQVARGEPLSPMRFSHSVHNAPAGLFSIAAGNRAASSAVAGMEDTLAAGLAEAAGLLERARDGAPSVLLVAADEPLPALVAPFGDEPGAWAAAFWLAPAAARGEGRPVVVEPAPAADHESPGRPWPDALELVRLATATRQEVRLATVLVRALDADPSPERPAPVPPAATAARSPD